MQSLVSFEFIQTSDKIKTLFEYQITFSGSVLAKHRPGMTNDTRTHQGPTSISCDGQKLELRPPLPLQWADLYSTWNMAFITNSELTLAWPYYMVKLLIPSVRQ